jgi:hypothetical protein
MKIPSRLIPCTLALACALSLASAPAFAAEASAPDAPAVTAEPAEAAVPAAEASPVSTVGTPEALPMGWGDPLGNCRVRCGFQFYTYGGMTESQCCNEPQYCPDGSVGNAVSFQPYGGYAERCAP